MGLKITKKGIRSKLSVSGIQNLIIFGIFIIICICLSLLTDKFLSITNFRNIIIQVAYVVIVGSATAMIIISGNLDFSIGAVAAMGGVAYALLAKGGVPTAVAIILAILISGTLMGLVNGVLVSRLKMPSFIVTLSTMFIARGIAYIGAGGAVISSGLPGDFGKIGKFSIGPLSAPIIYSVITFLIFLFIQNKTTLAKKTYVIGANPEAAELSGIKISKILIMLYMLSGTFAAFVGVFMTSSFGIADSKIFTGLEFEVIIAAVLGGTDINGGRGTIFGVLMGALIIGVLSNAMNIMGLAIYYQQVIKGIVLICAIILHRTVSKRIA